MVVVLGEVYVAGAARIDAVYLLDLGGSRSLLRRLLGRLLLLLRGRLLLALGLLCAEQAFHVLDLMMLGHIFKNNRQISIVEHLHMVLRLGAILGQNFRDFPGGYAEVLCDLVYPVFIV